MLKIGVAVLAIVLAGTAGAAGWRDLRVDGSSEAAFQQSLAAFNEELSPERQSVFSLALIDVWNQGTAAAKADQREFTVNDYRKQLDGLSYDEVVTLTDPTGETAKRRYEDAKRAQVANNPPPRRPPQHQIDRVSGSQDASTDNPHGALDAGALMGGRSGGTVTHDGRPVNDDARKANPQ